MPLILTQNERSESPVVYDDHLGISYEYPPRYQSLIDEGERFIYYRGKLRADGTRQTPHYFGTGVIGQIKKNGELYSCEVLSYQPFNPVVPFKIAGRYLEPGANTRPPRQVGLHYRPGVRWIDQGSFDAICRNGTR